jgi:para-nitrobenzyl esterase
VKPTDIDTLYALTPKQLLEAQQKLGDRVRQSHHRITPFQPLVDGDVIPERPMDAIKKGSAEDINILAGTNRDEWKLFAVMDPDLPQMNESDLHKRLSTVLPGEFVTPLIETYRKGRKQRGEAVTPAELLTAINTDMMFRMPKIKLLDAQKQWNSEIFNFLFTWRSPIFDGLLGACHGLEIGFVFGTHGDEFSGSGPNADKLSDNMQSAWIAFARNGKPDSEEAGSWEPYGDQRLTMILDDPCRLETAPFDAERRAWETMSNALLKPR